MMLSKHVPVQLAIKSITATRYGIKNYPANKEVELNMINVCENVIEPVIEHFHIPDHFLGQIINSFYRGPELNTKIPGASNTSQHTKGEAVDLDFDDIEDITNADLFRFVCLNLNFHQVIWEGMNSDGSPEWVHIGLRRIGNNAKRITKATRIRDRNGKFIKWDYKDFVPDFMQGNTQSTEDTSYKKSFAAKLGNHKSGYLDRFDKLMRATNQDFTL